MYVLGLSGLYHDAAAVLLRDGEVVAAVQEERFTGLKHDAALPVRAAAWCLAREGITAGELHRVVWYEKPLRKFDRILSTAVASFPRSWRMFPIHMRTWLGERLWLKGELCTTFGISPDKLLFCEHHLSHAASAFYPSPHPEAAVLCVDGVGEWATTSLWRGSGTTLTPVAEVRFPHSLGLFYSTITAHLGFAVNEGEYKVMGMAPYGEPRLEAEVSRLVRLTPDGGFALDLDWFAFHWHPTESGSRRLADLLGPARHPAAPFDLADPACRHHADVAASAQRVLESSLLHLLRHAHTVVPAPALCYAGGVALNAMANRRLAEEGPFPALWIQPAAGDAGGALGAALWAWHAVEGHPRRADPPRVDLGRDFARDEVRGVLDDLGATYADLGDAAPDHAAEDLARGEVIGWMDGRCEWGPRALGHRSILADPRSAAMRDRVNASVKFREPFRPFAPSTRNPESFAIPAGLTEPSRWMLTTVGVNRPEELEAVTHVDGSARVQVVRGDGPFARLIDAFGARTGVSTVLNTSFNLKGEPMVSTPIRAMATFARSGLDHLYVHGYRVERPR